jgi:hypothetical protein
MGVDYIDPTQVKFGVHRLLNQDAVRISIAAYTKNGAYHWTSDGWVPHHGYEVLTEDYALTIPGRAGDLLLKALAEGPKSQTDSVVFTVAM